MSHPLSAVPARVRLQPALEAQDLVFQYPHGGAGVDEVSLTIAPGELVVVVGPPGAGKTTLLNLIAGYLQPRKGWVRIGGVDQVSVPVRERDIGIVFQARGLFPAMRVWENVAYPLRVRGVRPAERRSRAQAMLVITGLEAHAERMPAELSIGQQQRVALARALVFGPRALLLDEPLSALDPAVRLQMREEVRRIQRDQRIATLMITHDQDEALTMADRVVVMRAGRIQQIAAPRTLYDRPANRFVASFIGRANLLEGKMRSPRSVETGVGLLPLAEPVALPANGATRRVAVVIRPERIRVLATGPADIRGRAAVLKVAPVRDSFHGALRRVQVAVLGQVLTDPATGATRLVPPDPDMEAPPLVEIETRDRRVFDRILVPAEAVRMIEDIGAA